MRNLIRNASIAGFVVAAASAGAQTRAADAHWQAWIGCWRAVTDAPVAASPRVCVVPAGALSSVEIVTIDSGKVLSRYTVDATGTQRAVSREGCDGWERASWSADSLRVFLRSDFTCGAGLKRTSSGIMSITPSGDWVDVQTVVAGGNEVVRAVRYMEAGSTTDLTADVAAAVSGSRRFDARAALVAAGAQLNGATILEAARAVDTSAVQAWLMERRQQFLLDARSLVALADAGVPASITDMMVALSYPDQFHFNRDAGTGGGAVGGESLTAMDSARIASDYLFRRGACDSFSRYSPFGWGADPCFGSYGYGRYGYSPYGYRNGYSAYGYSPYDYGYYGYYTRPIVIVRGEEPEHGRAVKGQGYTRGSSGSSASSSSSDRKRDSGDRAARPTSSGSSGSSSSSGGSTQSSSSGASSSSSSGSSGASTSSTGRTAHPRPPLE